MAFQRSVISYVSAFLLLVALCFPAVEGQSLESTLDCRTLLAASCAFSVDSYGARCVLQTSTDKDGNTAYHCQTSGILSYKGEEYIESEDCVKYCGVDRFTVGLSTGPFFVHGFADKLCSSACQRDCPNIVDLFTSIVASTSTILSSGEGPSLSRFCSDFQATRTLRPEMRASLTQTELLSLHGISRSS